MSLENDPSYVQSLLASSISNLSTVNDTFFMFFMAVFIFFMQFGFGLFEAGVARTSYPIRAILVRTMLCIVLVMLVYYLFGYALAFGGVNLFGGGSTYWAQWTLTSTQYAHFWLQYAYAVTCCMAAMGAWAERCRMPTYLVFCFLWGGFVFPIVSHWAWTLVGFLYTGQSISYSNVSSTNVASIAIQYLYNQYSSYPALYATAAQYLDVSGSGVVHLSAGVAGLIGSLLLGPRPDRFNKQISASYKPHSSTLVSVGGSVIFFGMLAFNCGGLQTVSKTSAATSAMAMVNTVLSAAGGMLFVFAVSTCKHGTYDYFSVVKGGMAGTVAASCSAALIYPWAAVIVGCVAGLAYLAWSGVLQRLKVDDPTDAFAVHAGAAMWGLIALAFLHPQFGILFGVASSGYFLAWQLVGIACVWAFCGISAAIIFGVLRLFRILRISKETEAKSVEAFARATGLTAYVPDPEAVVARRGAEA